MPTVAGVDSSTQSCKVVVCDAESGTVLDERSAPHSDGTECPPEAWWDALASMHDLTDRVESIGVAGQQHGMVTLDERGEVVRPALLWNDTRSAAAAERLVAELGEQAWADRTGVVPVASFTLTKLAWLAEHEPENAGRVARVMLPHDYLVRKLSGDRAFATDRGDASGTAYWSPRTGAYDTDLMKLGFGRVPELPEVLGPSAVAGETPQGALLSPGTGDNMGAALGLGLRPGDVAVSLGTSGTVFAVHSEPVADPSGIVAGFADATGRYLPLVCTLNAARVLDSTAGLLGVDPEGLDRLALAAEPGAGGLSLLPYLDGERTPNLPDAAGSVHGLRRDNMTRENLARAAVEGMLCGLADGLDALRERGVRVNRILLIGGAARSGAARTIAPTIFGAPVHVPAPAEYVALGAARQAAWTLRGGEEPPEWSIRQVEVYEDVDTEAGDRIRSAYSAARDGLYG